jgi:hypothetical protein
MEKDYSDLTKQLIGLEGKRVEAITLYGEKLRFWVGKSTGWKPIHLEVLRSNSIGGTGAHKKYQSVTVIRHSTYDKR